MVVSGGDRPGGRAGKECASDVMRHMRVAPKQEACRGVGMSLVHHTGAPQQPLTRSWLLGTTSHDKPRILHVAHVVGRHHGLPLRRRRSSTSTHGARVVARRIPMLVDTHAAHVRTCGGGHTSC